MATILVNILNTEPEKPPELKPQSCYQFTSNLKLLIRGLTQSCICSRWDTKKRTCNTHSL